MCAALDNVVAQNDADLVAVGEMLRQRQRVGNAALAFLVGVVDVLEAESLTVGQEAQKVTGVAAAGHEHDVLNTRIH